MASFVSRLALPATLVGLLTALSTVACSDDGGSIFTDDGGVTTVGTTGPGDGCNGSLCEGQCVNLMTDESNCGGCGVTCGVGMSCIGGQCSGMDDPCADGGGMLCDGQCVDTNENSDHCGMCDNACAEGMLCTGGMCVGGDSTGTGTGSESGSGSSSGSGSGTGTGTGTGGSSSGG